MALIICPECGKEFSNRAVACPNCGFPTSEIEEKKVLTNETDIKKPEKKYNEEAKTNITQETKDNNQKPDKKREGGNGLLIVAIIMLAIVFLIIIAGVRKNNSSGKSSSDSYDNSQYSSSYSSYSSNSYSYDDLETLAASALYDSLMSGNSGGVPLSRIYDIGSTRYSVGSIKESSNGGWDVKGTFSLYNDYGEYKRGGTFSVHISETGKAKCSYDLK